MYQPHSPITFCHEEIQKLKMISCIISTCFCINLAMHNLTRVCTEATVEVVIKELGKNILKVPRH